MSLLVCASSGHWMTDLLAEAGNLHQVVDHCEADMHHVSLVTDRCGAIAWSMSLPWHVLAQLVKTASAGFTKHQQLGFNRARSVDTGDRRPQLVDNGFRRICQAPATYGVHGPV